MDSSPLSTAAIIANSTTSSSSKNSVSFKAASSAVRTGMRSIRSRSDSTLVGRTMTSHSRGAEAAFEAFNRPGTLRLSGVSHTSGPRRSWSRAAIRIARRRIRSPRLADTVRSGEPSATGLRASGPEPGGSASPPHPVRPALSLRAASGRQSSRPRLERPAASDGRRSPIVCGPPLQLTHPRPPRDAREELQ